MSRPDWLQWTDSHVSFWLPVATLARLLVSLFLFTRTEWTDWVHAWGSYIVLVACTLKMVTLGLLGRRAEAELRRMFRASEDDQALLTHSAIHGDLPTVLRLLEKGAEGRYVDDYGHTPLELASRHNHHEVVDAMLAYGAHPLSSTNQFDTDAMRRWRGNNHPLQVEAARIETVLRCNHNRALWMAYATRRLASTE